MQYGVSGWQLKARMRIQGQRWTYNHWTKQEWELFVTVKSISQKQSFYFDMILIKSKSKKTYTPIDVLVL